MRSLFLLFALTGCEDVSKGGGDGISTNTTTAVSDPKGIAPVYVDVKNSDESFLVTAETDSGHYIIVDSVEDPSANKVFNWEDWTGANSLTGAIYVEGSDLVFNWPVRKEDTDLFKGTWAVNVAVITTDYYYAPNVDVDATVQVKADSDLHEGKVRALVVYADGVDSDAEAVAGTEAAVDRWKEIWGAYGLDLKVDYADGTIDPDLPFPGEAGSALADESEAGTNRDITVIIGEAIDGETATYYGVAGSIPGALVPAPRSAVVVSWLANAGGDGTFSDDDIRLYGETLAHEVGHYTGLFHPVEMTWDAWDALDDTSDCSKQSTCENDLGDNLMFPYPVCDWSTCVPQDQLTSGQENIGQRYTGCL